MKYVSMIAVVAIAAIATMYFQQEDAETSEEVFSKVTVQESPELKSLPAIAKRKIDPVVKKAGPHGTYDPHSSLTPEKHIQVALQHKQEGRINEALKSLDMALIRYGNNKDLLAVRGSLYLELNQPAAALKDLNKAIEIAPDDASLLVNRAQVYRQFGQIADALADLNRAVELNSNLLPALFNRGAIYYSSSDFKKALNDFDQCIAIEPHTAGPYFNRASAKQALGDLKGAKSDLERFMQLSKSEAWINTARELMEKWTSPADEVVKQAEAS